MASIGTKIGSNINTNTDLQLDFTSKFPGWKVYKWGNRTISLDGSGNGYVDISHDLNYAPSFTIFVKNSSGQWFPIGGGNNAGFGNAHTGIFGVSDTAKLRIQVIAGYAKMGVSSIACRYYLLVDKAQAFTGTTNISLTGDVGFKIADGVNVFTGKEYQMKHSTKYKSLQYFTQSIKQQTLSLPAMFSSYHDQDNSEYQYINFNHGLGYKPFFKAWYSVGSKIREIPYNEFISVLGSDYVTNDYYTSVEVNAFCDATKIRVEFRRRALFDLYQWLTNGGGQASGQYSVIHAASTITVTVLPFAENLEGSTNG